MLTNSLGIHNLYLECTMAHDNTAISWHIKTIVSSSYARMVMKKENDIIPLAPKV